VPLVASIKLMFVPGVYMFAEDIPVADIYPVSGRANILGIVVNAKPDPATAFTAVKKTIVFPVLDDT
jgi:hypothetical protein